MLRNTFLVSVCVLCVLFPHASGLVAPSGLANSARQPLMGRLGSLMGAGAAGGAVGPLPYGAGLSGGSDSSLGRAAAFRAGVSYSLRGEGEGWMERALQKLQDLSLREGRACDWEGGAEQPGECEGADVEEQCSCGYWAEDEQIGGVGGLAMVCCPKTIRTHCRKCKVHQEFRVSQYKTGAARLMAQGKRRYDRKMQGFGGQKKPIFHKKAKITKKISIKLQCTECKTMAQRCLGRTKHFILGAPPGKAKKGDALNY